MLICKTTNNEMGKVINIASANEYFDIFYGGNGDLYFSPNVCGKNILTMEEPIEFVIDETDTELYPLFFRLYQKITDYDPYDEHKSSEDDEDILERLNRRKEMEAEKDSYRKYPLVHDGIISWHSDEDIDEQSSIINISMEDGKIILQFIKSHPNDRIYETYSIRFRNSGSSYTPFNIRFMELYNALCEVDFDYHQISIKECMSESEKQKVYVKK